VVSATMRAVSSRLVRAINLSIAVLLLALLFAAYWFAYRPLPKSSGQITAPVSARATVARDARGVPHISAASWEDAVFLQGFATAQDRMWQMDGLRRLAAGELAEVVGPAALDSDRDSRRLRLSRIAEASERAMPAADRAVLAAFARGVNYFLETHRGSLPLEFTLLNYEPRPWRVRDSILAGLQMYKTLTNSWRDEMIKLHARLRGDAAKVDYLFPPRSGFDPQPGSNAWALSGSRTASGKPILANDPHLDFAIPSTWYLVHLQAPGLNVSGASLPGVPGVIVGHNDRIAWGVTNLQFDVQDLVREQFDPQNARYVFKGQTFSAGVERELIPVKGEKPSEFAVFVTRHGPVVAIEDNQYYALQWTAADASSFTFPFLDLNRAKNWTEFTTAIARFPGPGQNFVYADVDGNIGYHATGHLPIRKNCKGDVPADGASGECEWQGYIPFDQLPNAFNPASGAVVTANQNPFPDQYDYTVSGNFAAPYRARRIRELLDASPRWNPAEMLNIQKDVYSAFSHFLAKQVVAAWDARKASNPELQEAVVLLRGWNGMMEKGAAAPMLVTLVFQELRKTVAESASPGAGQSYEFPMATAALERLLRDRPIGWFSDYDAMLMKCFSDAAASGTKLLGSKISRWDYGKYNELRIVHPVGNALPLVGSYFNIGPVPMSGSSTTVKQTTRRMGPSMRMIADLSDWDRSLQNITIGESGQIFSSHYKDQWEAYYAGTSFPMQFTKVDAKAVLVVNPR